MKVIISRLHVYTLLITLLLLSVLVDLSWHWWVGFIRDDAFITFRYAKNLADGLGFVYNPGEHVYGTSSPGFALLMAAWLFIFPDQPVAGAIAFDISASVLSLYLVWKILDIPVQHRALVLVALIVSDKVLLHTLEGMELPFVILCMLASYYLLSKDRIIPAGITAGLMLWFRIDSILWIFVLVLVFRRSALPLLLTAGLVYLPWLVFAQIYFGSVIPMTAIAKQAAYSFSAPPVISRAIGLYSWMTPFTLLIDPVMVRIAALVTYTVAAFGAWIHRRSIVAQVLALFFLLQSLTLIATNMTVEQRYFITTLYALLILFGLGLAALVQSRYWTCIVALVYAGTAFYFALPRAEHLRDHQAYVYDASLTQIGIWLWKQGPGESVVYLEPLGYAGYYSRLTMRDDVGFVTPAVVPLKRMGVNSWEIASALDPDYVVLHCDDAERAPDGWGYGLAVRFDPLDFMAGGVWEDPALQRNACYQVNRKE